MTKWVCDICVNPCTLKTDFTNKPPNGCPYQYNNDSFEPNWKEEA